MPRPTLPSCLKDIRSFPVLLTKDSEEKIYTQITDVLRTYSANYEKWIGQNDQLLQRFHDTNPYLAWSDKAWRNLSDPEGGKTHAFLGMTFRDQHRWTWEWWKRQMGKPMKDLKWRSARADQDLCCEAFPEWSEKEGWAEWDVRLQNVDEAEEEEEFRHLEARQQEAAWNVQRERDAAWIQKHVLILHHQANKDTAGHACDQCEEAKEAEVRLQTLEAERVAAELNAKLRIAKQEADIQRQQDEANEAFEKSLVAPKPADPLPQIPCEICKITFCSEKALQNHEMSREHKHEAKRVRMEQMKGWFCKPCGVQCQSDEHQEKHCQSARHRANLGETERSVGCFKCEICDYQTPFKQVQERHLHSIKHIRKVKGSE